jgi:hypothetical protein
MGLILCPITLKDANVLVARWHRHHGIRKIGMFAIACCVEGEEEPCGAVIVARPVARALNDGWTAEVARVATNGHPNACSFLLGAAWRACRAMGYRRLGTYTLPHEGGASLRAAGWTCVGSTTPKSWNTKSRPRVDNQPLQKKLRWERSCD